MSNLGKRYKKDINRDLLYPKSQFYQLDLVNVVNDAIKVNTLSDDMRELANWVKFAKKPNKDKALLVTMLQALFLGQGGYEELNIDFLTEDYTSYTDQRVAMMFFSAKNKQLLQIGKIIDDTLSGYNVITLNGSAYYKNNKVTNRNSESFVKDIIKNGKKPTIIVASSMAQRSFSIPEITELYLCFDGGSCATTIQKMSRVLTPYKIDKIGKVFSLSFEPNRDDKFDRTLLQAAVNIHEDRVKRGEKSTLRDTLQMVIKTIDVFKGTDQGAIRFNPSEYIESLLTRDSLSRIFGSFVNLKSLEDSVIEALEQGNNGFFQEENDKEPAAETGKVPPKPKTDKTGGGEGVDPMIEKLDKARKVVINIINNLDVVVLSSGADNIDDALVIMDTKENREWVFNEFGVELDTIVYLINKKVIKKDWVELYL